MWQSVAFALTVAGLLWSPGGSLADDGASGGEPLYLSLREPGLRDSAPTVGLLFREIPRQALLIAARDECGVATRDFTLREEFPPLPTDKSPEIQLQVYGMGQTCKMGVFIKRNGESARHVVWHKDLSMPRHGALLPLVEEAEALSRSDFPDLIRKEGMARSVRAPRAQGEVPRGVEELLSHWSEIDTFHALRLLHGAIRDQSESPELLAALVIAYANLGALTDRQWSVAHKAFTARALLYAQRLMLRANGSPWALAHRAYARSLAGLHAAALVDVASIRSAPAKARGAKPIPAWLDTLALFCEGRSAEMLEAAKSEPTQSLALVLQMLQFDPTTAKQQIADSSKALLEAHPNCHRAAEGMCAPMILGVSHSAALQSLAVFRRCVGADLKGIPGVPEAISKKLAEIKDSEDLEPLDDWIAAFVQAMNDLERAAHSDRTEPSLSALASLLREMAYLAAYRRFEFKARMLGVPTVEDLPHFRSLVERHPYAGNLDAMSNNNAEFLTGAYSLWTVDFRQIQFMEGWALQLVWANKAEIEMFSRVVKGHADETYRDLVSLRTFGYLPGSKDETVNAETAAALRAASPNLPAVRAMLVDFDWKSMEKQAPQLEKEQDPGALVLSALANKYVDVQRWDDAERCFKRLNVVSPTYRSYHDLADVYAKQGDMGRWKETLERSLELPSHDLEDARVQVELAEYHIKRKEYRQALPYGDGAARSYAAFGLLEAARCHELVEDWSTAEKLIRAEVERYEDHALGYMLWCYRTGHGDRQAAQDIARRYFESLGTSPRLHQLLDIGIYHILLDEPRKAVPVYKEAYHQGHRLYDAMQAALLSDRLGDANERDALLKAIASADRKQGGPEQIMYIGLAAALRDALASGKPTALDLRKVDGLAKGTAEGDPTNLWYFVGVFLDLHGDKERSREYLQRCATSPVQNKYTHVLARVALRKAGAPIGPPRDAEIPTP